MAVTRKTISITTEQDAWIKGRIQHGDYTNESEYVRDLIRRDQERLAGIEALRVELMKGEASGDPQPFDWQSFHATLVTDTEDDKSSP